MLQKPKNSSGHC